MTTKWNNGNSNPNENATAHAIAQTAAGTENTHRNWLWWFLTVLAASQLYFVRELVAAFAMFAIAFVAIAFVAASLYMLTKASQVAFSRLAELRHPVINIAAVPEERKAA